MVFRVLGNWGEVRESGGEVIEDASGGIVCVKKGCMGWQASWLVGWWW